MFSAELPAGGSISAQNGIDYICILKLFKYGIVNTKKIPKAAKEITRMQKIKARNRSLSQSLEKLQHLSKNRAPLVLREAVKSQSIQKPDIPAFELLCNDTCNRVKF